MLRIPLYALNPRLQRLMFALACAGLAVWALQTGWHILRRFLGGGDTISFFGTSAFFMTFVVHAWYGRDWRWRAAYAGAGVAILAWRYAVLPDTWYLGCGIMLGCAGIVVTCARLWAVRRTPEATPLLRMLFWTTLVSLSAYDSLRLVTPFTYGPLHLDGTLYLMDLSLGFNPMEWFGTLFYQQPLLQFAARKAYGLLPAAVMAVYALELHYRPANTNHLLKSAFIGGVLTVLYVVAPACGPKTTFGAAFPYRLPEMVNVFYLQHRPLNCMHNAMPSLHFTWALLLALHARLLPPWVRAFGLAFVALTLVATMGTGHHYLMDLIVAVPLSVGIYAFTTQIRRMDIYLPAFGLTMAWLLVIRHMPPPDFWLDWRALVFVASCATLFYSAWLKRALDGKLI